MRKGETASSQQGSFGILGSREPPWRWGEGKRRNYRLPYNPCAAKGMEYVTQAHIALLGWRPGMRLARIRSEAPVSVSVHCISGTFRSWFGVRGDFRSSVRVGRMGRGSQVAHRKLPSCSSKIEPKAADPLIDIRACVLPPKVWIGLNSLVHPLLDVSR